MMMPDHGPPQDGPPPGLAEALHGAGGPPPQGVPPELLAALTGGGGPQAGGPPPGQHGQPGIDDPAFKTLVAKLAEIAANEPDAQDAAALLDLVAKLKKLIGGRQDAGMSAMGGNPSQMRAMSRAYGG
jgi:hypothetical protein